MNTVSNNIDYSAIAALNHEHNNTNSFPAKLNAEVLDLIFQQVPLNQLPNVALTCKTWRGVTNGIDGTGGLVMRKTIYAYLQSIAKQLEEVTCLQLDPFLQQQERDADEYKAQVARIKVLMESVMSTGKEDIKKPKIQNDIKEQLIDILPEVKCSDLDKIEIDEELVPQRLKDAIEIAKRTFKGKMSLSAVGAIFTEAFNQGRDMNINPAGRRFVGINKVYANYNSKKFMRSAFNFLLLSREELETGIRRVAFPFLFDVSLLEGKEYGDTITLTLKAPMDLGGDTLGSLYCKKFNEPLHFKLKLFRDLDQPEEQSLSEKVAEILANPENRADTLDKNYSFMMEEGHGYDRNDFSSLLNREDEPSNKSILARLLSEN